MFITIIDIFALISNIFLFVAVGTSDPACSYYRTSRVGRQCYTEVRNRGSDIDDDVSANADAAQSNVVQADENVGDSEVVAVGALDDAESNRAESIDSPMRHTGRNARDSGSTDFDEPVCASPRVSDD